MGSIHMPYISYVGVLIPNRKFVGVTACDHDPIWANNLKAWKIYIGSGPAMIH
jgi:hypothetical protein